MKLTEGNVHLIEHKLISDQLLSESCESDGDTCKWLCGYLAGVNDMAQAVADAIKEMK